MANTTTTYPQPIPARNLFSTDTIYLQFYRLPQIKAAYKRYVRAMVTRYKHSPAIMAWELANEARCAADSVR